MQPDQPTPPAAGSSYSQQIARIVLAPSVLAVGLCILADFLPALAWAAVLAIALWPLYRWLLLLLPEHSDRALGPLLGTVLIGIVFIAPLVLLGIAGSGESHFVVEFIAEARHTGIPVPGAVERLNV